MVTRDGGTLMTLPCSYGEQGDVDRNVTRSGIHVVSEKHEDFYMSNPAAGYFNVHERFAVRISNNGEFIHANPETVGVQGSSNVTNGCINLSLENAQQYFGTAIYGDPVEVTGTRIRAVGGRRRSSTGPSTGPPGRACRRSRVNRARSRPRPRRRANPDVGERPQLARADVAARRRLIARADDDLIEIDVRWPRRHEPHHLGDVVGDQRGSPGVHRVGLGLIAIESHQ